MDKSLNRAAKKVQMCFSYRGADFEVSREQRPSERKRFAKKATRRAVRRLSRVLARDE